MSAACFQSFRSFLKLSNKQHMGSFYAPTCKTDCLQILCKFSKNWISAPNIVHQLTLSLCCKYCKIRSCSNFPDAINSIRRSRPRSTASQWLRQSSMTLFVSNPFVDARTCLYKAIFDGFWGIWTTKCCRPSALPYVTTRVLRHLAWNFMHGLLQ